MAELNDFGGDLSQEVPWQLNAACRGSTDLFFSKGRSEVARLEQDLAKGVCRGCGVRRHCFEAAFARDDPEYGVWGGLSEDERRSLDHRSAELWRDWGYPQSRGIRPCYVGNS